MTWRMYEELQTQQADIRQCRLAQRLRSRHKRESSPHMAEYPMSMLISSLNSSMQCDSVQCEQDAASPRRPRLVSPQSLERRIVIMSKKASVEVGENTLRSNSRHTTPTDPESIGTSISSQHNNLNMPAISSSWYTITSKLYSFSCQQTFFKCFV